jgi:hypothetical protein
MPRRDAMDVEKMAMMMPARMPTLAAAPNCDICEKWLHVKRYGKLEKDSYETVQRLDIVTKHVSFKLIMLDQTALSH